ncbi:hypothetical protein EJV46_19885 [Roseococcus sp. SYP-B2431]|uniref:hypothetical protein n=1 Tax=Roseococcus sp. SYP-B2431 TaxID=2496640 RepID=UPI00103E2D89|nr:hypothetical protein [Roseococcus sp. SYP-B2431]TCH96832.1 hypothetical protein EJV46_19885 [Roseococcus sp. SYP-B2431]
MFRPLLVAGLLISGAAVAGPDIRSIPGGVHGSAPARIIGTDGGGLPVIQRPEIPASRVVRNGVARLATTGDDRTITYSGAGRGSFGAARSPSIVSNENGRPELRYSN